MTRKIVLSLVAVALWALFQLELGGFYDVITWSVFALSLPAAGFVAFNYLTWAEKVISGQIQLSNPFLVP